jgi:hypothetical protein
MSMAWRAQRFGRPLVFAVIGPLSLVILGAAGCQMPDATVRLEQPQLSGLQSEATLLSRDVIWGLDDASRTGRLVARFPLPGAMAGEETYLLYLRWPEGRKIVPFDRDADFRAVGFFIQVRGRHAGLTSLARGHLTIRGTSQSPEAVRRLNLDVTCEDGTKLQGELVARRNDWAVTRLERRERPADVENLPPVLKNHAYTASATNQAEAEDKR